MSDSGNYGDDTDRYALVDRDGPIPYHNGYEDVRAAHREAERIGKEHPNESVESVNVVKIDGSESVTFRIVDTETGRSDGGESDE